MLPAHAMYTRKKVSTSSAARMTNVEREAIARQILQCEKDARAAIAGIEVAERILQERSHNERTRASSVDRLERAVAAAVEAGRSELHDGGASSPRVSSHAALALLSQARELRWRLAMSAQHVAIGEARKLYSTLMPLEDLVQEGMIGIYRAALRFDPDRGIHFTTYAHWWVRAQMTRALETDGCHIRLPGGVVELLRNLNSVRASWEGNEPPTVHDYAERLNLDPRRVEVLLQLPQVLTFSDITEDDECLFEPTCDADQEEVAVITSAWRSLVEPALNDLDTRSRRVLHGIYEEDRTRGHVGLEIGLSRERVRQIEGAAIQYLRAYASAGDSSVEEVPKGDGGQAGSIPAEAMAAVGK